MDDVIVGRGACVTVAESRSFAEVRDGGRCRGWFLDDVETNGGGGEGEEEEEEEERQEAKKRGMRKGGGHPV